MKAFLYTLNDKVVANPERRPDENDFIIYDNAPIVTTSRFGEPQIDGFDNKGYDKAIVEWTKNCIEVVNVVIGHNELVVVDELTVLHSVPYGQPCELEGNKVTKILNNT